MIISSLINSNVPADPASLAPYSVNQWVSMRTFWKTIQPIAPVGGPTANPSDPSYNWSFLDSEILRCQQAGKGAFPRVFIGQSQAPAWLYGLLSANQIFTDSGSNQHWLWWDPTALSYCTSMIQAMGARYANSPIRIVNVTLGVANGGDWSFPHTAADITNLMAAPYNYTSSLLVNACQKLIDASAAAFPNAIQSFAVGQNGNLDPVLVVGQVPATPDKNYIAEQVIATNVPKYGGRFAVQKNGLATFTLTPSQAIAQATDYAILGLNQGYVVQGQQANQQVWNDFTYFDNGGVPAPFQIILSTMMGIANLYFQNEPFGATPWFELYEQDVKFMPQIITPFIGTSPQILSPNTGCFPNFNAPSPIR